MWTVFRWWQRCIHITQALTTKPPIWTLPSWQRVTQKLHRYTRRIEHWTNRLCWCFSKEIKFSWTLFHNTHTPSISSPPHTYNIHTALVSANEPYITSLSFRNISTSTSRYKIEFILRSALRTWDINKDHWQVETTSFEGIKIREASSHHSHLVYYIYIVTLCTFKS